jgi:hypothetical protein
MSFWVSGLCRGSLDVMGTDDPDLPSRVTHGSGFSPLVAAVSAFADWLRQTTQRLIGRS